MARDFAPQVGLALVGLMFTVPFVIPNHDFPIPTFYPQWTALALGLAAAVFLVPRKPGNIFSVPHLAPGLACLAAVILIQVGFGHIAVPERSYLGVLYVLWAGLLVWFGLQLRERLGLDCVAHVLQVFLVVGGWVVAACGFIQYYRLDAALVQYAGDAKDSGMFGYIGQRNLFANYLGCALASLVFLSGKGRLNPIAAGVMALPLALGLAMSGSRSAWIYVLMIPIAAVWAFVYGDRVRMRRLLAFSVFVLLIFACFQLIAASTSWLDGPSGRPIVTGGERWMATLAPDRSEQPPDVRAYLFREAWSIFLGSPVLGTGFGEFAWNLFLHGASFDGKESAVDAHSHNLVLQLLSETGVIGALCVAIPLLVWAHRFPWREASPDRGWLLAVLAIEGAHSMVEYPLWHAEFLGIAAVLLGVGSFGSVPIRVNHRFAQFAVASGVLAGAIALGSVLSDYRSLQHWFLGMQAAGNSRNTPAPSALARPENLGTRSLVGPYYDLFAVELIRLDRNNLDAKLTANGRAMRFFPVPTIAFRQVLLLYLKGDRDAARSYFKRIAVTYPSEMPRFLAILERNAILDPLTFGEAAREARVQFAPADLPPR